MKTGLQALWYVPLTCKPVCFIDKLISVLLCRVGEVSGLHVVDIGTNSVVYDRRKVGVAPEEFRRKSFVDTKHIVHHQYLTVDPTTGAYANDGNRHFACNTCGEGCGIFSSTRAKQPISSSILASSISF